LFQLEATIAADTGAAFASGFNRIATVGLQSKAFGAVNLGRQTSVIKDSYDQIDPFGDGGTIAPISAIFFNGALTGDAGRISNSVKYSTPTFGGFKASTSYSFGEVAGDTGANSAFGIGAGYVNGPLNLQAAYNKTDASTVVGTTNPAFTNTDAELYFLGGTYNFGVVKLHGAYAENRTTAAATNVETKYRNYLLGVSVPLGAAGNLFASYSTNENTNVNNTDAERIAVMYTYDLSKRTNLYTGYSHTSNDNGSRIGLLNSTAAAPLSAAQVAPLGESASAFNVGVRHKF
jgi:predicted porin